MRGGADAKDSEVLPPLPARSALLRSLRPTTPAAGPRLQTLSDIVAVEGAGGPFTTLLFAAFSFAVVELLQSPPTELLLLQVAPGLPPLAQEAVEEEKAHPSTAADAHSPPPPRPHAPATAASQSPSHELGGALSRVVLSYARRGRGDGLSRSTKGLLLGPPPVPVEVGVKVAATVEVATMRVLESRPRSAAGDDLGAAFSLEDASLPSLTSTSTSSSGSAWTPRSTENEAGSPLHTEKRARLNGGPSPSPGPGAFAFTLPQQQQQQQTAVFSASSLRVDATVGGTVGYQVELEPKGWGGGAAALTAKFSVGF